MSTGTSATEDVESDELSVRAQRQNELQNMQGIEDTSILEDLAEAEEEYDKPDQVRSGLHAFDHGLASDCTGRTSFLLCLLC